MHQKNLNNLHFIISEEYVIRNSFSSNDVIICLNLICFQNIVKNFNNKVYYIEDFITSDFLENTKSEIIEDFKLVKECFNGNKLNFVFNNIIITNINSFYTIKRLLYILERELNIKIYKVFYCSHFIFDIEIKYLEKNTNIKFFKYDKNSNYNLTEISKYFIIRNQKSISKTIPIIKNIIKTIIFKFKNNNINIELSNENLIVYEKSLLKYYSIQYISSVLNSYNNTLNKFNFASDYELEKKLSFFELLLIKWKTKRHLYSLFKDFELKFTKNNLNKSVNYIYSIYHSKKVKEILWNQLYLFELLSHFEKKCKIEGVMYCEAISNPGMGMLKYAEENLHIKKYSVLIDSLIFDWFEYSKPDFALNYRVYLKNTKHLLQNYERVKFINIKTWRMYKVHIKSKEIKLGKNILFSLDRIDTLLLSSYKFDKTHDLINVAINLSKKMPDFNFNIKFHPGMAYHEGYSICDYLISYIKKSENYGKNLNIVPKNAIDALNSSNIVISKGSTMIYEACNIFSKANIVFKSFNVNIGFNKSRIVNNEDELKEELVRLSSDHKYYSDNVSYFKQLSKSYEY